MFVCLVSVQSPIKYRITWNIKFGILQTDVDFTLGHWQNNNSSYNVLHKVLEYLLHFKATQNAYTYNMYIALAYEHFVSQAVRTLEGPCLTPLWYLVITSQVETKNIHSNEWINKWMNAEKSKNACVCTMFRLFSKSERPYWSLTVQLDISFKYLLGKH